MKKSDRRDEVVIAETQPDGQPPKKIWSHNKTLTERVLGIIGQIIAIVTAALVSGFFVGSVMFDRAFDDRIDDFHIEVQPQIYDHVASMIELHRLSGPHPGALSEVQIKDTVSKTEQRLAGLEARVAGLERKVDEQNDLIRELIRSLR